MRRPRFLRARGARRSLAGSWKFKVATISVSTNGNMNQVPTVLWNKMINPLLPYPIKGALWYQGESNANPGDAVRVAEELVSREKVALISGFGHHGFHNRSPTKKA